MIATMPGTCIGVDTSSQSQESCRAIVFIFRQVDAEGTLSNGLYAEWYWAPMPHGMGFKDSVVENFNWACATSAMAMTCSLLLAAVVLATGAANIFTRDTANTHGFQYAPLYLSAPFCAMGVKINFVCSIATMPGTCIGGDTSFTKSRKMPRHASFFSN